MKNNFKRVFALLIAVVMCVTCVLPVFASDAAATCPGAGEVHTKANCVEEVVEVIPAECGKTGYTKYQCTVCNTGFIDDIDEGDCDYVTVEDVAATCVADGYLKEHCNTHNQDKTTVRPALDQVNDPKQHTWGTGVENTETGKIDYTCTVCGATKSEDKDPHVIHTWGEVVLNPNKLPTCTEDGEGTVYCTFDGCDASKVIPIHKTSDLATHTWDLTNYEVVSEKTCAAYEIWKVTCSVCGAVNNNYENTAGGKDAHDFSVEVQASAPGCTTPGWIKYYTCATTGCDEISINGTHVADPDDIIDPAVGHKWVADTSKTDVEPTCGQNGIHYIVCSVCGETDSEVTPMPSDHSFVDEPIVIKPTCTTKGVTFRWCTNCLQNITGEYINELDHHLETCTDHAACIAANGVACGLEVIGSTAGDCTTAGTTTYGCKICKDTATGTYAHTITVTNNATAGAGQHNLVTVTVDPTCMTEGSTYQKCTICTYSTTPETVPVDKNAHQYHNFDPADPEGSGYVVVTAPTCTAAGSAWRYCKLCEAKDTKVKTLDPLGHKMPAGTTPTVEATCQNKASYTYVCETCNVKVTEERGEFADHDYVEHAAVAAGCETDGNAKYYTCNTPGCNKIFDADKNEIAAIPTITATGHDWDDLEWTAPTCTNPIVFEQEKCGNCNTIRNKRNAAGAEIYHVVDRTDATQHDCTHDASYVPQIGRPGSCSVSAMEVWACTCAATADVTAEIVVGVDSLGADIKQTITIIPKGTTYGVENEAYGKGHVADAIYMEILPGDEAVTATCLVEGKTAKYTCSFCNETIGGENLGYADHTYEEHAAVAPDCTTGGNKKYYVCTAPGCGDIFDAEKNAINSIPFLGALGHDEVVEVVEATCTEVGGTYTTCTRCDYEQVTNPVAATGHDYLTVITNTVSCHQNQDGSYKQSAYGYIHVRCQNPLCSTDAAENYALSEYVYEFEYPVAHTFVTDKDCLEGDVDTCSVCGYYVEHEARGEHKNANGDVLNCSNVETVTDRVCAECGETITHATIQMTVPVSCTQDGYTLATCRDCDYFYVVEGTVVKAPGHTEPTDFTVTSPATCTTTGTKVKNCTVCGETVDTDTIPTIDHVYTNYNIDVVEPSIGIGGHKTAECDYGCGNTDTINSNPLEGVLFYITYDNAIKSEYDFVNTGRIAVTIKYTAYNANISSLVLALSFDPSVLTYDGSDANSKFTGFNPNNCDIGFNNERGKVNINAKADTTEGIKEVTLNGDGELCTIYFNVADLAGMNTPLTLSVVDKTQDAGTVAVDKNGNDVAIEVADYTVPTLVRLGDVNKDNVVNDADTVALLQISFANGYLAQADINQDGKVDFEDYLLLKQFALQKITYAEMCVGVETEA